MITLEYYIPRTFNVNEDILLDILLTEYYDEDYKDVEPGDVLTFWGDNVEYILSLLPSFPEEADFSDETIDYISDAIWDYGMSHLEVQNGRVVRKS